MSPHSGRSDARVVAEPQAGPDELALGDDQSADRDSAPSPAPTGAAPRDVGAFEDIAEPPPPISDDVDAGDDQRLPTRADHVVAVLVCHEGGRWLPPVLTSLAHSRRQPEVIVAMDAGSTDSTPQLLADAVAAGVVDHVLRVPATTTFGSSVTAALAAPQAAVPAGVSKDHAWFWLLHDDCAPAPDALDALLRTAEDNPSAGILGPKLRGWHDRRLLLEAGVTVSRSGARVTGLEPREYDQGQHDDVRDVLAVSSAGMLIRRDVWQTLGGFDPGLPLFRDDMDLCWRAQRAGYGVLVTGDAIVHHRAAATHGRRKLGALDPAAHAYSPKRLDRAAAMHLLLSHASRLGFAFLALRVVFGSLLRTLGFLLGKSPQEAGDEFGALRDALGQLRSLRRSRARVRAAGEAPNAVSERDVRRLMAPRSAQLRVLSDRLAALLTSAPAAGARSAVLDNSDTDDSDAWDASAGQSWLRRLVWRPGSLLLLGLLASTLVAVRSVIGTGALLGGALLAAPTGAGDLVSGYLSDWHSVALGSGLDAPPWLMILALPAALLRGQAPLAVDILILLAVPLAGVSAYASLRGVINSSWIRSWAAIAYALLPALPVAVGSGRLGTCAVAILLPPLARSSARLLGVGRAPTWRRAWGTGLLLAIAAAFVPVIWLIAVTSVVVAMLVVRSWVHRLQLLTAVLTPIVLLGPWVLRVLHEPGLLLLEPGLNGPVDWKLNGLDLVLLHPGGPGSFPIWWLAPLLLAAVLSLLRRDRFRVVLVAWGVALIALAWAVLEMVVRVSVAGISQPIRPWAGTATLIAGGALIAAVAFVTQGLRHRIAGVSFGVRQPAVIVLLAAVVLATIAPVVAWTGGVDGPLRRGNAKVVPAFVAAELQVPSHPRVLVLQLSGDHVSYELLSSPGPTLGDRDVAEQPTTQVSNAVGGLVAGVGADEVDVLAAWSVKYVLLLGSARADTRIGRVLDSESGLRRVAGANGDSLWRIGAAVPRASLVALGTPAPTTPNVPVMVPSRITPWVGVDTPITPITAQRRFLLTESAAAGWQIRTDGPDGPELPTMVSATAAVGRLTATLPAGTSAIWAGYDNTLRTRLLWIQAIAVFLVIVFALPGRRRPELEPDEDDTPDPMVQGEAAAVAEPEPADDPQRVSPGVAIVTPTVEQS